MHYQSSSRLKLLEIAKAEYLLAQRASFECVEFWGFGGLVG